MIYILVDFIITLMLSINSGVSTYNPLKKTLKDNKATYSCLYLINNKNILSLIMLPYKGLYLINELGIAYILLMPLLFMLFAFIIMP